MVVARFERPPPVKWCQFKEIGKPKQRSSGRNPNARSSERRPALIDVQKIQTAPSVRDVVSDSASYAPAQFGIEFGSNRSDDICGVVLGEATDEKYLISQRQAGRDVLWKYGAGSSPYKR
jgi:hypothetical protein